MTHVAAFRISVNPLSRLPNLARLRSLARPAAQGLLLSGGAPVVLDDIWLPARLFKGLTAERLEAYRGPMYGMFEAEFGVQMIRAEEKIRAVAAAEAEAALLGTAAGAPLLQVERRSFTYADQPVELRRGLYRTDAHYYRNELN